MRTAAFTLVLLSVLAAGARSEIPALLNYQVMLTDDSDQPLADQTVTMEFSIYDVDTGGVALWTETHNPTTNSIGVVSVLLGSITPVTFDFDVPLWLEVEVDGQTLSPRRPLAAAPYAGAAAVAGDSERLGGTDASEYALLTDIGALGDGHSLDAVDGDPEDAVYVDEFGYAWFSDLVRIGEQNGDGQVRTYAVDGPHYGVDLATSGAGGSLDLQDENGIWTSTMGPDIEGTGGFFAVARDGAGNGGFIVDGNSFDTGAPTVYVSGPEREIVLDTSAEGNDSVRLPNDAVSSAELRDEPGIASIQSPTTYDLPTGSVRSVAVRTISNVPAAGYVVVMGTAHIELSNTDSNADRMWLGVSDLQNAFSNGAQEMMVGLPPGAATGIYHETATVHGVFSVDAGSHEFYLNALEESGNCAVVFRQLTLMYFPTAYGGVDLDD